VQTRFYVISEIVFEVSAFSQKVHQIIQDKFQLMAFEKSSATPLASVFVENIEPDKWPETGAVLNRIVSVGTEIEYRLGSKIYDFKGSNYSAIRDIERNRVNVKISELNDFAIRNLISAIKWLVICVAEQLGYSYFHAAAVRYGSLDILFCGNSGSGKSSCAVRLAMAGASIFSDDSALLKKQRVLKFDLNASRKGDFSSRFKLVDQSSLAKFDSNTSDASVEFRPNIIVFPQIWYNGTSALRPIDKETAMVRLLQIYRKEVEWNAAIRDLEICVAGYREIIGPTQVFEFMAGQQEAEVDACLKTGLGKVADQLS
jgi:hypothetical protein